MDNTNAERQRRYIERLKARAAGVTNAPADANTVTALRARIAELEAAAKTRKPDIDPATFSKTAQQKLASAVRQHQHKLERQFEQRVRDEVKRRVDEIILPHWQKQIDEAQKLYKARRALMDKATFNKIRRALHPDSRHAASDKVLADAFDAFMGLEKYLLNEKDLPTTFGEVPSNLAEWDRMRARTAAERRAKRAAGGGRTPARR